jgi:hypothetical protein
LYFKMTASNASGESLPSAVVGPVTIGNSTAGTNTVSGTVTFTGAAPGASMMVGVGNDTGGFYFTTIANPVSPQSYTIQGVPNGSYFNFAVIDNDNSGTISTGDITNVGGSGGPNLMVSGNSTGNNISLSTASATAYVNTDHQLDDSSNNYYSLILGVGFGTKQPVGVTVFSGANIGVPYDMGTNNGDTRWIWLGSTSPTVGDTYKFRVTFSDGTTQDLSASVTAPANFFAQSLAAVMDGTGGSSAGVPYFTWADPASPPAFYTYGLNLWGNAVSANWNPNNGLPSSQHSALYNYDGNGSPATLTTGTYTWQVQVRDANGNSASRMTTLTVP